jgi:phosphopantothenoylcysteine synthetase/decarboxylase
MRILITSGGTREPIDDVRFVGNVSSGQTGALIAAEAVRRFHSVQFLAGVGSMVPPEWALATGLVQCHTFTTTESLLQQAQAACGKRVDAMVACAAVADFSPTPYAGKLSSGQESLTLTMRPTPKVVDAMRQWAPDATLVAFKLETGISPAEVDARARATMARCGADYIVANDLSGHGTDAHPCRILGRDGSCRPVARRQDLSSALLELLEQGRQA